MQNTASRRDRVGYLQFRPFSFIAIWAKLEARQFFIRTKNSNRETVTLLVKKKN